MGLSRMHLLVGCSVAQLAAAAWAQPPGHGFHPPMPDQKFYLQCRLEPTGGKPVSTETSIPIQSAMAATDLDMAVSLPAPGPSIRVKKFLPRAALEQTVVQDSGPAAKPAVELAIEGPTQSYHRWLLADDAERNRLISFIATWRYMAVADARQRDALFEQFKGERTREPMLVVSKTDGGELRRVPAREGWAQEVAEGNCHVRVIRFFPHYGVEKEGKQPVNVSERRVNPAALVEIARGETREERWVFAKFPDFKTEQWRVPIALTLDCPLETQGDAPDFVLVTIARSNHEVWEHDKGKTTTRSLAVDEKVAVSGSPYTFRLAKFVAAGRLDERYLPAEEKGTVSALEVEVRNAAGPSQTLWLESGKQRAIPTDGGLLLLAFGPRTGAAGTAPHAPSTAGPR